MLGSESLPAEEKRFSALAWQGVKARRATQTQSRSDAKLSEGACVRSVRHVCEAGQAHFLRQVGAGLLEHDEVKREAILPSRKSRPSSTIRGERRGARRKVGKRPLSFFALFGRLLPHSVRPERFYEPPYSQL